jgi:glycerol uptake facilitator-like aquaporin
MKKYLAEFLGTFILIFVAEGTFLVDGITGGSLGLVGIALAQGFVLMTLIYSLMHVSGAFFNPAITLTMFLHKRIKAARAAGYVVCQLLGAASAALLLLLLFPTATALEHYGLPLNVDPVLGIVFEAILTFFLVATIYGAYINKHAPKGFYGLTIGSVLIFGPALASGIWGPQVIYWVGPIAGAIVASYIYEYLLSEK